MPAKRNGAPRPGGELVDDEPLPPAMTPGPEPSPDAIARHSEGHENRFTPVLRNAVPARADPFDSKLDEAPIVCLRSARTHLLEVGFRQRPGRGTDRHGDRHLAVDDCP